MTRHVHPTSDAGTGGEPELANQHDEAEQSRRRHRGWLVLAAVVGVKLAVVAAVLLLPSGVALSLGAAHALVLLIVPLAGAGGLLLRRHQHHWARSHARRGRQR